jgi:hypothetical protein
MLADPEPLPPECRQGVLAHLVKGTEAESATCRSLMDVFESIPDPRARSGMRYPQKQLLGILALGMLCGCQDLQSIVILGERLSQRQLEALGGWRRRRTGMFESPGYSAYYNLIGQMDAEAFDGALCRWFEEREGCLPKDLALDGKVLRGTADGEGRRLTLIALVEKHTQRPVAQQAARVLQGDQDSKQEGELTAARRLLENLPGLDNAVVTADAMFARTDIAQSIVMDKGGNYVLALKDNNPTLHAQAKAAFDAVVGGSRRPQSPIAAPPPFFGKAR